jgi:hypothetical protein
LVCFEDVLSIRFDGPGRLQPLPSGHAVIAKRLQEANHFNFVDRKLIRPASSQLAGVAAYPSWKPLAIVFADW